MRKGEQNTMIRLLSAILALTFAKSCLAACPIPIDTIQTPEAKLLKIHKLYELMTCSADDPLNDKSPCNTFAGKSLKEIYNVPDFEDEQGGFLSANGIFSYVGRSSSWHLVGNVLDSDNNYCAQTLANHGRPVVAVLKEDVHGHVALVIPGYVASSASWGIPAAYSASFLYEQPSKSYIGGPLSKAFKKTNAARALFYYRTDMNK